MTSLMRRLMKEAARMGRRSVAMQEALRAFTQPSPYRPTAPASQARPAAPGAMVAGSHAEPAGSRDYKLFLPPRPVRSGTSALVVMLHGCKQDPDDFAAGTQMNVAAARHGFFVLYPGQSVRMNPSRCWNWFKSSHQRRGRGEASILAGMTAAVVAKYAIDPQRVYVAGLSAGGAMAAILGDAYPELFAAVGVHSGLPTGAASDMSGAFAAMAKGALGPRAHGPTPPTIVFHGDEDTTVHPVNGEQVIAASAGSAGSAGSAAVGAAGPRKTVTRGRSAGGQDYTREVYQDPRGHPVAEHWVVHGAGHAWSGGSPQGSYTDAAGPDATAAMLAFFFKQRGPVVV